MLHVGDVVRVIAETAPEDFKAHEYTITTAEIACNGLQFKLDGHQGCWFPNELELIRHSPAAPPFAVNDTVKLTTKREPLPEYMRYTIPPVTAERLCRVESVMSPCLFSETNVHYNLVTIDGERRFYGSNGSNLTPYTYSLF